MCFEKSSSNSELKSCTESFRELLLRLWVRVQLPGVKTSRLQSFDFPIASQLVTSRPCCVMLSLRVSVTILTRTSWPGFVRSGCVIGFEKWSSSQVHTPTYDLRRSERSLLQRLPIFTKATVSHITANFRWVSWTLVQLVPSSVHRTDRMYGLYYHYVHYYYVYVLIQYVPRAACTRDTSAVSWVHWTSRTPNPHEFICTNHELLSQIVLWSWTANPAAFICCW